MALNIWTPFTADRSILAGGQALAQGVGRGLTSVGDAISKAIEQKKERTARAKSFETIYKGSPALQKLLGMDPEDFSALSADDKIARATGGISALHMNNEQAKQEMAAQQQQAVMQQLLGQMEDRRASRALPGKLRELLETPAMAGAGPLSNEGFDARVAGGSGMTPGALALIRAAEQTGAPLPNNIMDDLIRGDGAMEAAGPLAFEEDPITGQRFARQGKSVLPSGTNPARVPKEGQEIFDADGNLLGHNVPTGGGKFAFRPLKPQSTGELLPVLDPVTRRPVPGLGMDASGKVHDYRNVMQKSGFAGAASADAPDNAASAAALKADAKRAIALGADPAKVNARLKEQLQKLER